MTSWGSLVVLPKHLLQGQDINTTPFSRKPVGLGPYRLKEWKTGEKIVLEANPNYFEGRPYLDGFVYRIIPDPATMFLELKAGGIDYMGLTPTQYMRQTETYKMRRDFRKFQLPGLCLYLFRLQSQGLEIPGSTRSPGHLPCHR